MRYPIDRLKYDGYTTHHYAYMIKVIQKYGTTCFEDAQGKTNWDTTMDEEMAALDANHTWDLVPLSHDKKAIECKWV